MIHKSRNNRRWRNHQKAKRKWRLNQSICGDSDDWLKGQIHRYDKGKIHCSCVMCSAKTNASINKSKGPVCGTRNFSRLALTNKRYGKKHYKPSDIRKVDSMNYKETEIYMKGDD